MTAPPAAPHLRLAPNEDQIWPTLTSAQVDRIAAHGRLRRVERGEVLIGLGKKIPLFFVVKSGTIEAVQPTRTADLIVTVLTPGEFSGEVSILSGRRSLVTLRVGEAGEAD